MLPGVIAHIQHHGAVDAQKQHGGAPEGHPPRAFHGQQAGGKLVTVALHRGVEHVHQRAENKGAADIFQPLNALKAEYRKANLQTLESNKVEGQVIEAEQRRRHHVEGTCANPALKTVPDDGRNGAHQTGNTRAGKTECTACLHHKRDAVFVASSPVNGERHANHKAANGDGQGGLKQVERAHHA